jgi:hypothetical protein
MKEVGRFTCRDALCELTVFAAVVEEVQRKLSSAFDELHEYIMVGTWSPNILSAIPSLCLSRYMDMNTKSEYRNFLEEILAPDNAVELLYDAFQFLFNDVMKECQEMVEKHFVSYRARQFHIFTVEVLAYILELEDLAPGSVYTVSDCVHSYVQYKEGKLNIDNLQSLTHCLEGKYQINPEHSVFFIQHVQEYEKLQSVEDRIHNNRFQQLLDRLQTVIAQNFYSYNAPDFFDLRVGIVAAILLNREIARKEEYDISNIVTLYIREHDKTMNTPDFFEIVRVLDDFSISSDDVIFIANHIEHRLPLSYDLHASVPRKFAQILATCLDVMARFIRNVNIKDFSLISLKSVKDVLSRDALQSDNEDLVFDLISDYVQQRGEGMTTEEIVGLWRTCRLHLLSAACYARAFQEHTPPKEILAAALIHHKRKQSGEVDERKCEFDSYAKSMLVLRPRLSLEQLAARRKEDEETYSLMEQEKMDPDRISPVMKLQDDLITLECIDPDDKNSKAAALCKYGFDIARGGIFSFEVTIEAVPEEFWEVLVGVCDGSHPLDSWVGSTPTSWSYLALHSGSRSYYNSVCDQYNAEEILKVGDVVGLQLDCTDRKSGVMSFTTNGIDRGVAFEGIKAVIEEEEKTKRSAGKDRDSDADVGLETSDDEVDKAKGEGEDLLDDEENIELDKNVMFPFVSLSRRGVKASVGKFKWRRH